MEAAGCQMGSRLDGVGNRDAAVCRPGVRLRRFAPNTRPAECVW